MQLLRAGSYFMSQLHTIFLIKAASLSCIRCKVNIYHKRQKSSHEIHGCHLNGSCSSSFQQGFGPSAVVVWSTVRWKETSTKGLTCTCTSITNTHKKHIDNVDHMPKTIFLPISCKVHLRCIVPGWGANHCPGWHSETTVLVYWNKNPLTQRSTFCCVKLNLGQMRIFTLF